MNILQAMKDAAIVLNGCVFDDLETLAAVTLNLNSAIEEMEKAEPVAWRGVTGDYGFRFLSFYEQPGMEPLYTHPAPEYKP